jgi:hypothetical protein
MKTLHVLLAIVTLVLACCFAPLALAQQAVQINGDNYAVIVFSQSTGNYGYGWDCGTYGRARQIAFSHCKEADAREVAWVQFGWAVLVIAEDGSYATATVHGAGATAKVAVERARQNLRKYTDKPVKTTVIVCSGDINPRIIEE